MSLDTVDWYPIDAGIVTYEITDVNCSFGVWNVLLFEDIQLGFYSNWSFEKIGQF
jgi:hypothetical protein